MFTCILTSRWLPICLYRLANGIVLLWKQTSNRPQNPTVSGIRCLHDSVSYQHIPSIIYGFLIVRIWACPGYHKTKYSIYKHQLIDGILECPEYHQNINMPSKHTQWGWWHKLSLKPVEWVQCSNLSWMGGGGCGGNNITCWLGTWSDPCVPTLPTASPKSLTSPWLRFRQSAEMTGEKLIWGTVQSETM